MRAKIYTVSFASFVQCTDGKWSQHCLVSPSSLILIYPCTSGLLGGPLNNGTTHLQTNSQYNKSGQGSQCNQAIMLVTDGAPYNFEEIFSKYNWPHLQVRVFTYLIGREEKKKRDLRWMACANKGEKYMLYRLCFM